MKRELITSSNIRAIGYENGALEVEFSNGGVYQYKNIPLNIYQEFLLSSSKGKYFAANIKGKYEFIKVG